jgi:hypothetical protein
LKGWSRKKKEALFKEDWEELKRLSKSTSDRDNKIDGALRQAQGDSFI